MLWDCRKCIYTEMSTDVSERPPVRRVTRIAKNRNKINNILDCCSKNVQITLRQVSNVSTPFDDRRTRHLLSIATRIT